MSSPEFHLTPYPIARIPYPYLNLANVPSASDTTAPRAEGGGERTGISNLEYLRLQRLFSGVLQETMTVEEWIAKYTSIKEKLEGTCSICTEPLQGKQITHIDACTHLFHWDGCLKNWLNNPQHRSCPDCRKYVKSVTHLKSNDGL